MKEKNSQLLADGIEQNRVGLSLFVFYLGYWIKVLHFKQTLQTCHHQSRDPQRTVSYPCCPTRMGAEEV